VSKRAKFASVISPLNLSEAFQQFPASLSGGQSLQRSSRVRNSSAEGALTGARFFGDFRADSAPVRGLSDFQRQRQTSSLFVSIISLGRLNRAAHRRRRRIRVRVGNSFDKRKKLLAGGANRIAVRRKITFCRQHEPPAAHDVTRFVRNAVKRIFRVSGKRPRLPLVTRRRRFPASAMSSVLQIAKPRRINSPRRAVFPRQQSR